MIDKTSYTKTFYDNIYPSGQLKKFSINWWSVRFYALIAERLLNGTPGRIFDAGCGIPFVLARLERKHETWGMDISEYAITQAKKVAPKSIIFNADIEEGIPSEIPRGYFDLVMAKYLFEHLKDPGQAISLCYSLLASGGRLLISVPNMQSPMRKIKKDNWFANKDKTHISLLEPYEWKELIKNCGFKMRRVFSDGFWDIPYLNFFPNWLQYLVFSVPCAVEVFFALPLLPWRWGENIIIIAVKQ